MCTGTRLRVPEIYSWPALELSIFTQRSRHMTAPSRRMTGSLDAPVVCDEQDVPEPGLPSGGGAELRYAGTVARATRGGALGLRDWGLYSEMLSSCEGWTPSTVEHGSNHRRASAVGAPPPLQFPPAPRNPPTRGSPIARSKRNCQNGFFHFGVSGRAPPAQRGRIWSISLLDALGTGNT